MRLTGVLGLCVLLGAVGCKERSRSGGRDRAGARPSPHPAAARRGVPPRTRPGRAVAARDAGARRSCALPWDLRPGMTLAQVVRHFRVRRIVVLHLRDHIVTFRPPSLHGVRFRQGRVFVGATAGSAAPATLNRVELLSAPLRTRADAQRVFRRATQGFGRALAEVAWRRVFKHRRVSAEPRVVQGWWQWRCGPRGRGGLTLDYARLEARAARGRYEVRAAWRYNPRSRPVAPPHDARFEPAAADLDVHRARRVLLRPGARWQDHGRVYDLSFLPNGRVVILGGDGTPESYAGQWQVEGAVGGVEVRLTLRTDDFYASVHRYRVGRCREVDRELVPCLQAVAPVQLPTWFDR